MKNLVLLFCICIVMSSCNSGGYDFEKNLYQCFLEETKKADVDAEKMVIDAEKFLLENNILKNNKPEGYFALAKSLSESEKVQLPKALSPEIIKTIRKFTKSSIPCTKEVKGTEEFINSRYADFIRDQEEALQEMRETGDISYQNCRKGLLIFTKKKILNSLIIV